MVRFSREDVIPVLVMLVAVVVFFYVGYKLVVDEPIFGNPNSASASAPLFDHSQCQYPNRQSNPVDGCDNTDPADPLKAKGGQYEGN